MVIVNKSDNTQPNIRNVNASNNTYAGILAKEQERVMHNIINLTNERTGEERKTAQNKQKKTVRTIGQYKKDTGKFRGQKPKVWMLLYRVENDVDGNDIIEYLKERTGQVNEEFLVEHVGNTRNNLKCFKVAADFRFKEEFYSPTFWPHGVGYRRFDFAKDERQFQKKENNTQQPSSFLGATTV